MAIIGGIAIAIAIAIGISIVIAIAVLLMLCLLSFDGHLLFLLLFVQLCFRSRFGQDIAFTGTRRICWIVVRILQARMCESASHATPHDMSKHSTL